MHDREVFNNSKALQLEISKVRQYTALERCKITTPKTIVAVGDEELIRAASKMGDSFITKHNRAEKGLGVQLFLSVEALKNWIECNEDEGPIDGIWLLQQYIKSPEPFITRCEFIGGKIYTYDINTNTNYNREAENIAKMSGMGQLADFLGEALLKLK